MRTVDLEVAEELRDEPELLALADAVASTQRRRPGSSVAVAVAAVVVLAAVFAVLIPQLGNRASLTGKALAAIGDGPVIHAVLSSDVSPATGGAERINLATGQPVALKQTAEVWFDSRSSTMRTVMRLNGQVFETVLQRPGESFTSEGPVQGETSVGDPLFTVFARDYRDALKSGQAHEAGRASIRGRDGTWLEFSTQFRGMVVRVAVSDDGAPFAEQVVRNGRPSGPLVSVESIESIETPSDLNAPVQVTQPSSVTMTAEPATPEAAKTRLGGKLAWAGDALSGLRLAGATAGELRFEYSSSPARSVPVASLVYGDLDSDFVRIQESTDPASLRWRGIIPPRGSADLFASTARTQIDGVYVLIDASAPELAQKAARALSEVTSG
jgi:hypothetical protein